MEGIETSLDELVDAYDDAAIYKNLLQEDPEGMIKASEEEKLAFEKRLGL